MAKNIISLHSLNAFALSFNSMSLKDFVLFRHIVDREGITCDQLVEVTGYDERNVQSALRKLTGSRLAAKNTRYQLVKEAPAPDGRGYFLTGKGREFIRLT